MAASGAIAADPESVIALAKAATTNPNRFGDLDGAVKRAALARRLTNDEEDMTQLMKDRLVQARLSQIMVWYNDKLRSHAMSTVAATHAECYAAAPSTDPFDQCLTWRDTLAPRSSNTLMFANVLPNPGGRFDSRNKAIQVLLKVYEVVSESDWDRCFELVEVGDDEGARAEFDAILDAYEEDPRLVIALASTEDSGLSELGSQLDVWLANTNLDALAGGDLMPTREGDVLEFVTSHLPDADSGRRKAAAKVLDLLPDNLYADAMGWIA